jgi:myosin heavy subunit
MSTTARGKEKTAGEQGFLEAGSRVWIPHGSKAFCCVEVVAQERDAPKQHNSLTVAYVDHADDESGRGGKGSVIVPLTDVLGRVEDNWLSTVNDLVDLTELSEPALLHHLKQRYANALIYACSSPSS